MERLGTQVRVLGPSPPHPSFSEVTTTVSKPSWDDWLQADKGSFSHAFMRQWHMAWRDSEVTIHPQGQFP